MPSNKNWISDQTLQGLAQFDEAMKTACDDSNNYLQNGEAYLKRIGEECNYIRALEDLNWAGYLPQDAHVLDLGCGGGWLTAILSKLEEVSKLHALDSSYYFLQTLLPQVFAQMEGHLNKVEVVEGLFQPLLFDDATFDAVVASSAVHHADNLESLLKEMRRVTKPGGYMFIVNETPWSGWRHTVSVAACAVRILRDLLLQKYYAKSPAISASGYLYDPVLGDRDYPIWYWVESIKAAGFAVEEIIDSELPTVADSKGRSLKHFICRAV
ncbi:class I SAM-dependent methyltransferase [Cohaesibacter gelatinilyticus]|uniref:Methyltransferase domain-containing protein n=1 Tax=Cohaesibacter gelatinilyticus TaxID=372072 RepID=A0A285PFW6_9HYPH|nr:class I SAM-dependent methyltransferase [Cohaesibacter gelatinilyticus]SNZ20147.1 Methyltransferase domain-containing protein [Cohaesibacter gelatinilyticus]